MSVADEAYLRHAGAARALVRSMGMHDCIHFAPEWRGRADALYAEWNSLELSTAPDGSYTWGGATPGLLADGRMVVGDARVWMAERADGSSPFKHECPCGCVDLHRRSA